MCLVFVPQGPGWKAWGVGVGTERVTLSSTWFRVRPLDSINPLPVLCGLMSIFCAIPFSVFQNLQHISTPGLLYLMFSLPGSLPPDFAWLSSMQNVIQMSLS